MEDITTLSLYESNWSLLAIDGKLLGSRPDSPAPEQWYQQDELKKLGLDQPRGTAPDLVDQLLGIQQQIDDDRQLDDSWLDTRYSLPSLLSGEPVSIQASAGTTDQEQSNDCVQKLLANLEKASDSDGGGMIDLKNGQHGSQTLFEMLTSKDASAENQSQPIQLETIGDSDLSIITSHIDLAASPDNMTSLSAEDIESIFLSCPSSPGDDDDDDSDPSWSPGGSISHTNKIKCTVHESRTQQKSRSLLPDVERKNRKKQQNRTAATRYRNKKRQEQDLINDEYQELQDHNKKLKEQVSSISQEIQYLKNLMSEVYKAKKV